jgi:peptidoglycan L-alanyl-D-glutamate endopeptidase CwlK
MASRKLEDLEATTRTKAERFVMMCDESGLDVLIYCTHRPMLEQAMLYRQSRTLKKIKSKARDLSDVYGRSDLAKILMNAGPQSGPHVTNAAPGQSLHGYRMAFDGVPVRNGKPVWGTSDPDDMKLWQKYGELAQMAGLEWAGHWMTFKEFPHCQQKNTKWQELI